MMKSFVRFSAICLMLFGSFSAASSQTKAAKEKPLEPTAKEVIKQILLNGDIPLSVDPSCKSVGSSPGDKTILDFVSSIISFQNEPDSKNSLEFKFEQKKSAKDGLVWVCDLMFYGADGENVWSNGLRVKIRNSDRKLLRDAVVCTGTG